MVCVPSELGLKSSFSSTPERAGLPNGTHPLGGFFVYPSFRRSRLMRATGSTTSPNSSVTTKPDQIDALWMGRMLRATRAARFGSGSVPACSLIDPGWASKV